MYCMNKYIAYCGDCNDLLTCETIKMIIDHNDYAPNNLKENK